MTTTVAERESATLALGGATVTNVSGGVVFPTGSDTPQTLGDWMATLAAQPEVLAAARTYYVRTNGSDSNDGLANTAGGAFLTIQAAVDAVYALDLKGQSVTIQVADGTYTGGVYLTGMPRGTANSRLGAPITIQGNSATPGNVIISTTSETCFFANFGASLCVRDLEMRTTTSGGCLLSDNNSTIFYRNVRFGTCAGIHKEASRGGGLYNGTNYAGGTDYSIVGSAVAHVHATFAGFDYVVNATVTVSGTPAFSSYFAGCSFGYIDWLFGITFSGSATGPRYNVTRNGVMRVPTAGGQTFFPGDSAGIAHAGGKYIIADVDSGNNGIIPPSGQFGSAVSHTGTTDATTLRTISVPAGSMGANGRVLVTTLWTFTRAGGGTDNIIPRIVFNGTTYASGVFTANNQITVRMIAEIYNANSASSQVGGPGSFPDSFGASTIAVVTSAHDTTAVIPITITGQLASATDTITLQACSVEVFYAP